jgi:two-component system chemotaxis response regulator CheY
MEEEIMKRVLIVDDAAFMRMSIRTMLQNYDFEIVGEAENGVMAIEKYQELQPDIVTLDITMPEMDGLQALREIKKIDPAASVVMVSALGQEARMKEAIIYGAKGFIVKPFKEEIIVSALSKL